MRTSTTFLLFAIVILAFVLFSLLSERKAVEQPQMYAARTFLEAVNNHDVEAVKAVVDPDTTQIIATDGIITAVNFKEVSVYEGAYSQTPEARFTYVVLTDMEIVPKAKPVVLPDQNLAYVQLNRRNKVYLRKVGEDWKVFYVSKPGADKTFEKK